MDDAVVADLAGVLSGPDAVVTDPATLTEKGRDYWGFGGQPGVLVRPRTRDEVAAVVRTAAKHHVPVVTRGGASNCCGRHDAQNGPCSDRPVTMDQILDVDPTARTARVEPGVINSDLQSPLAPHGLCFSPDRCPRTWPPSPATSSKMPAAHTLLNTASPTTTSSRSTSAGRRHRHPPECR